MNERQKKFYLVENIGDRYLDEKYETILQGLKQADTFTVWIKKNEVDEYEPQIFQIASEREILLDLETVHADKSLVSTILLLLGLGSLTAFLWFRFHK